MGTTENIATSDIQRDYGSIDPNITIPKHVKEAQERAEAIHKLAYPDLQQQAEPAPEPSPQPDPAQPEARPQPDPAVTAAVTDDFTAPPPPADMKDSQWAQRYNAMRGRWENSRRQVGAMQEQMTALAGELHATQNMVEQLQRQAPAATAVPPTRSGHPHENLITDTDRETYGEDLIEMTQRAARAAVAPEIDALRHQNAELQKRVTTTAQQDLKADLTRAVPQWAAVNTSPEFVRWLGLPNIYTGEVRGRVLRAAYSAANAPRVIAIFQDFLREVRATGGEISGSRIEPQAQQPLSREPAIQLDTLAAPGRARPSGGGDPTQNADKPFYTRANISANYASHRRGQWAGRDADWNRLEADMIAAAGEGRVR